MAESESGKSVLDIRKAAKDILETIDREREREIIARRFGLYDRKETLEQIGELLGITRERVRQLEKAVLNKLKATGENLPNMSEIETTMKDALTELGKVATIKDLAKKLMDKPSREDNSHVAFLAELAPNIHVLKENDDFHQSAILSDHLTIKDTKDHLTKLVKDIKQHGKPLTVDELHGFAPKGFSEANESAGLASASKHLTSLKDVWGHIKWPLVNPKNIRDKIYVILQENDQPMHFNEIADAIKDSSFKRKDVTTQAIHNELIKDKRFILIGRGIYALKEWGYAKGTVSDIISKVLKVANEPLHRDEIVKRVLEERQVKETTILLNLQSKSQFVRTAKATYTLE